MMLPSSLIFQFLSMVSPFLGFFYVRTRFIRAHGTDADPVQQQARRCFWVSRRSRLIHTQIRPILVVRVEEIIGSNDGL